MASSFRRIVGRVAVGALAVAVPVVMTPVAASAAPTELFFSEYVEGTSNNKALEVFNGTGSAVDLAAGGYNVQMFFNGSAASTLTINLTGTVAAGDVFVLAQSSAGATILAQADQTNGSGWYNGDDAVVLRKGTVTIDSIGQVGSDPGTEWGSGLASTADNTLARKSSICTGDPAGGDAFDPSVEWSGLAIDTFTGLGSHTANCTSDEEAPTVASVTPANGTSAGAKVTPTVTFSEPVNLAPGAISLACSVSGTVPVTVTGGPTTFTVDPSLDLVDGDSCTLGVAAADVSDQDTNDPPDAMGSNFASSFTVTDTCTASSVAIGSVQGSGAATPVLGQTTTVRGVVVGDYEGASPGLRGFYLQDAGDGDPATSDGIFVFNGGNQDLVERRRPGHREGHRRGEPGPDPDLDEPGQHHRVRHRHGRADRRRAPDGLLPPPSRSTRGCSSPRRSPCTSPSTSSWAASGRWSSPAVTGSSSRPTWSPPGPPALALQAANNLNRLIVDDGSQAQNPDPILFGRGGDPLTAENTLRGGDVLTEAVGVMTYTWAGNSASGNAFRLRPVNALGATYDFAAANARPAAPAEVGGDVTAASMNLLNYFNTFDGLPDTTDNCTLGVGGAAADCRGADTQAEFDRQWPKTVAAIAKVDADVLGVNEIENDGYGADSAIAHLVDSAERRARGRHLRLRRRRCRDRRDQRPGHGRHQGRHALQAGRRDARRRDGCAQHRGVRQRWRRRPAQPPVPGPGLRGQRDRWRLRRRRQPPEVQGLGVRRARRRGRPGQLQRRAHRGGSGAGHLAGRRPDRHR